MGVLQRLDLCSPSLVGIQCCAGECGRFITFAFAGRFCVTGVKFRKLYISLHARF